MKKFKEHIKSASEYDKKVRDFVDGLISALKAYTEEEIEESVDKHGIVTKHMFFNPPLRDVMKIVDVACEYPGADRFMSARFGLKKALETPLIPITYKGKKHDVKYHGVFISAHIYRRSGYSDGKDYIFCKMDVTLYYRHPNSSLQDINLIVAPIFRIE